MKTKTPLERSEIRLFVWCGVLILALLGSAGYWTSLEAEPNWNIPAPLAVPEPNGFDLYIAAANAIAPANPPVDPVNDPIIVKDPKIYAQKYSLARKQAWLKQNEAGFALFQKALKTPTVHPQTSSVDAQYDQLRQLARYKSIEVNARKMAGDWNGAMQSGIDTVQMGHDIQSGGDLVGPLVGIAIGALGRGWLYDVPEKMSAFAAKESAQRLENLLEQRMSAPETMRQARTGFLRILKEGMKEPNWRGSNKEWTWQQKLEARFTSKRRAIAEYERAMEVNIANAALPYTTPIRPLPEVGLLAAAWIIDSHSLRFSHARDKAGDIILMLRLALQAFRLERGHYPAQLQELTPTYLQAIPGDPFSNGPLHYKKTGETYLLWSIGPDGKNDKGKPLPYRTKPSVIPGIPQAPPSLMPESKGDYVAGKNR